MKQTVRQLLLNHHRPASPQLDAIRKKALAQLPPTESIAPGSPVALVADWIRSLRWHLAGLATAWFVVLILNSNALSGQMQGSTAAENVAPERVATALQERRRELMELSATPQPAASAPPAKVVVPPRRSQLTSIETA
jgi:hypothetical protein